MYLHILVKYVYYVRMVRAGALVSRRSSLTIEYKRPGVGAPQTGPVLHGWGGGAGAPRPGRCCTGWGGGALLSASVGKDANTNVADVARALRHRKHVPGQ